MSLFGAHTSDTSPESIRDISQRTRASRANPNATQEHSQPSSPPPLPIIHHESDVDMDDPPESDEDVSRDEDGDGESDEFYSLDEDEQERRPNTYKGPAHRWRRWASDAIDLHKSLTQIEAGDLSMHLYNVHAFKQRSRLKHPRGKVKPWEARRRWTDEGNVKEEDFIPSEQWTAWPLEQDVVPRPDESFNAPLPDVKDAFTIQKAVGWKPSYELQEELLAVMLRKVKERWDLGQNAAEVGEPSAKRTAREDSQSSVLRGRRSTSLSRPRSEQSTPFLRAGFGAPDSREYSTVESIDASEGISTSNEADSRDYYTPGAEIPRSTEVNSGEVSAHSPVSLRTISCAASIASSDSSRVMSDIYSRDSSRNRGDGLQTPVLLADDDRSRCLLQPNIRSTLHKLDKLLAALQLTRNNHLGHNSDSSGGDESGPADSGPHFKRVSRDGSRSEASLRRQKRSRRSQSPQSESSNSIRPTSEESDGQGKTVGKGKASSKKSGKRSKGRGGKRRPLSVASTNSNDSTWRRKPEPMDWSEVLGTASMLGFPSDAVDRAVNRCTALFNEGMGLRTFYERSEHEVAIYTPQIASEMLAEDTGAPDYESGLGSPEIEPVAEAEPIWQRSVASRKYVCPYTECKWHKISLRRKALLIQHLQRKHDYGVEREELANTIGSVHIDGYLRPVQRQQGWRGKGKLKATQVQEALQLSSLGEDE